MILPVLNCFELHMTRFSLDIICNFNLKSEVSCSFEPI